MKAKIYFSRLAPLTLDLTPEQIAALDSDDVCWETFYESVATEILDHVESYLEIDDVETR